MDQLLRAVSESCIDLGDGGRFRCPLVSFPVEQLHLRPNNQPFWCSEWRQRNLDVIVNHGKNLWISVLYFTLYVRLLCDVGCTVDICLSGFRVLECHVYCSQTGTLRSDVCTAKAVLEQPNILESADVHLLRYGKNCGGKLAATCCPNE